MARLPIQVQAIVYRKNLGKIEYLLLKRIKSKGGFWQPVTGGVEEGEDLAAAARREMKEEIGVAKTKSMTEVVYSFDFKDKKILTEYVFGAEISNKQKIRFDKNIYPEHDEYKWCEYKDAYKLLIWPGNKEALKRLNRMLSKRAKK